MKTIQTVPQQDNRGSGVFYAFTVLIILGVVGMLSAIIYLSIF